MSPSLTPPTAMTGSRVTTVRAKAIDSIHFIVFLPFLKLLWVVDLPP
jgi:hypothetical protein